MIQNRHIGFQFLVIIAFLGLGACAGKASNRGENGGVAGQRGSSFFVDNFKDEEVALGDSEFSIVFPQEESPGVRTISVRASKSIVNVSMNSSHKQLKAGTIDAMDYRTLLALIRQLDEKEFGRTVPTNCREPYDLKLKAGGEQRIFVGCRGQGVNATIVSKIAREVEFLVLRGSTGWRSK